MEEALESRLADIQMVDLAVGVEELEGLPLLAIRDLLATIGSQGPDQEVADGTVAAAYRRAAEVLSLAADARTHRSLYTRYPTAGDLKSVDVAFVRTLESELRTSEFRWRRPPLKDIKPFISLEVVETLGWLRVAYGETNGTRDHRVGCHWLSDQASSTPVTHPLWLFALTPVNRLCGSCGGPALHHLRELGQFFAAADVWDARGRTGVEDWQRGAYARLVGACLASALSLPDAAADGARRLLCKFQGSRGRHGTRLSASAFGPADSDERAGLPRADVDNLRKEAIEIMNEAIIFLHPEADPSAWPAHPEILDRILRRSGVPDPSLILFGVPRSGPLI